MHQLFCRENMNTDVIKEKNRDKKLSFFSVFPSEIKDFLLVRLE